MLELKQLVSLLVTIDKADLKSAPLFISKSLWKEGRELLIVGTKHTKNSNNEQVLSLKKAWITFLEKAKTPILCIEGFLPKKDVYLSDSDAIVKKLGEVGVLVLEANKRGIEVKSTEPSFQEVAKWAFEIQPDPQAFSAWALLNLLSSIGVEGKRVDVKHATLLQNALKSIGKRYELSEESEEVYSKIRHYLLESTAVPLPDTFEKIFSQPLQLEAIVAAQRPGESLATNRAAISFNLARDYGLIKNTVDIFESTNSPLFVWMGLNHFISQLPAYKYLGFKEIK